MSEKYKKIYLNMLVNAHKLGFVFLLLFSWNGMQAQEIWTLQQCVDSALIHNKNLHIAKNNIAVSQYKQKEIKASLFPKVSVGADYKYFVELPTQLMPMYALNPAVPEGQFRDVQFGVPHNITANLQLAIPIYNSQVYGAIESSKIASQLQELQHQKMEEQVIYDVTTLYYNAQILRSQLDFFDSNSVNTQRLLENMELLQDQKMALKTDVQKIELQKAQLQTQRENVANKYVQVVDILKLNMGIQMDRAVDVEKEIVEVRIDDVHGVNPLDINIVKGQNALLKNELKMLRHSRILPSLNFIASYGTSGFGYDTSPDEFLKFYPVGFLGLQLNYPLFDGTITRRKISQKTLEISNNELQLELVSEKMKVDMDNAHRTRQTAFLSIENTENQLRLADTIYTQTLLQQRHGTAGLTDLLLADSAIREAQQNYLNAIIEYLKADLKLRKLAGNIGGE